ncbi:LytR/AlgR family response regulator transcription factor [Spirosoma koreense]
MNLTAVAVDDEPQALDVIRLHAAKVPFLDLRASFTDAFDAIAYLQTNRVDVLFLDIKMPDISGVEVVKCLPKDPMVIFTTAYSDFAVQGFELDAVDYLLKPFSLARFLKACTKAMEMQTLRSEKREEYLFVKTGYEEEKVRIDEILYIEAEGNYLSLVLPNRKLLSRQTMTDLLSNLPPEQFFRIHRSFCVAVDKIEKLSRQDVTVGNRAIPIGASYESVVAELRNRLPRG